MEEEKFGGVTTFQPFSISASQLNRLFGNFAKNYNLSNDANSHYHSTSKNILQKKNSSGMLNSDFAFKIIYI